MLFAEPPPTQGDIHFRLWDTPVRIHPFFWVTALILGLGGVEPKPPQEILVWVFAVLISILVHEFGHAVLQRRYGGHPRVTLYGLGGLASCNDCDRSTKAQIEISLAGPLAGFLLAAVIFAFVRVTGHVAGFQRSPEVSLESLGLASAFVMDMRFATFYWEPFKTEIANHLVSDFIQINIMWGLINLLPIYPLDGGRVSREVCMLRSARQGIIVAWQISMFCAAAMVLVSLTWESFFASLLFGYLAYMSYRGLEAYRASQW